MANPLNQPQLHNFQAPMIMNFTNLLIMDPKVDKHLRITQGFEQLLIVVPSYGIGQTHMLFQQH
jgi:hypothetical protein